MNKIPTTHTFSIPQFSDNRLWYTVLWTDENELPNIFQFPIPVGPTETDGAIFHASDKPIMLMRWMRKHLEFLSGSQSPAPDDPPAVELSRPRASHDK